MVISKTSVYPTSYSLARVNLGNKGHRPSSIRKVTSTSTPEAADLVDQLYASIITARIHRAGIDTAKVREAAVKNWIFPPSARA